MMQPAEKMCAMEWAVVQSMVPWCISWHLRDAWSSPWCTMEHALVCSRVPSDASMDISSMDQPPKINTRGICRGHS